MTTKVIVEANHGWPVKVVGLKPGSDEEIPHYGGTVEAGEKRDFYVHSGMDLRVHEVQPEETADDGRP